MILKHNAGIVFQDRHRYKVLKAGRRFGKTFLFPAEIMRAARGGNTTEDEFAEIWYIAPTYRQAKRIFWKPLKKLIPRNWITGKPNETDLSIMLTNGIMVSLKGADNPDSLRGNALILAIFDEFDYMSPDTWTEIVRPMISTTGGRAIFAGTPDGKKHLAAFYERGQSKDEKDRAWASWKFTTLDGGWVSREEVEEMRGDMDENTFKQEIEAEDVLSSGLVYYAFSEANVKPCPPEIKSGPVSCGMDFNVDPWMAAPVFALSGEHMYWVDDIIIPRGNTPMMVAELISRFGDPKQGGRLKDVYPDPAGRHPTTKGVVGTSDFAILEQAGFRVHSRPSTLSVKNGINSVNSRLRSATGEIRMWVDPALKRKNHLHPPRMIDCMSQHVYKLGTSIPEEDKFKHLLDGCRYPAEYLFPIRNAREWNQ